MESGIESSQSVPVPAAAAATSSIDDDDDSNLVLLGGGGGLPLLATKNHQRVGGGDSLDAVQKMKLMAENKVLAPTTTTTTTTTSASPLQTVCNNNNNSNRNKSSGAPPSDHENHLQIVELSDLLLLANADGHPADGLKNISNAVGDQLIDFASEKCDVTPENLKKSDQEDVGVGSSSRDDSLLIDLGDDDGASASAMMTQFCDKTKATDDVQLTLLDLDEPPPPPAAEPVKPKAFTISFGEEERSQEQKQKYEKMFERFQNKRHRRGQSLSKVDVELSKSASQDSQTGTPHHEQQKPESTATSTTASTSTTTAIKPGQRLAKTPSSAKLPRKTFSEPSAKVCMFVYLMCSGRYLLLTITTEATLHLLREIKISRVVTLCFDKSNCGHLDDFMAASCVLYCYFIHTE